MSEDLKPACLILAYSRIESTIEIIQRCVNFGLKRIYVSIDGPRNKTDSKKQLKIREEIYRIEENSKVKIILWQHQRNAGVAVAIISAIDWFFEREPSGIIIEDDLQFEDDFLEFVCSGLEIFCDSPDIAIISGDNFFADQIESFTNQVTKYPLIWGWGTWADRWQKIRPVYFQTKVQISPLKIFDRKYGYWKIGHKKVLRGEIDTWDISFVHAANDLGMMSLIPPVNLVRNIGFDSFAVHTLENRFPLDLPAQKLSSNFKFTQNFSSDFTKEFDKALENEVFKMGLRHCTFFNFLRLISTVMKSKEFGMPLPERLKFAEKYM